MQIKVKKVARTVYFPQEIWDRIDERNMLTLRNHSSELEYVYRRALEREEQIEEETLTKVRSSLHNQSEQE